MTIVSRLLSGIRVLASSVGLIGNTQAFLDDIKASSVGGVTPSGETVTADVAAKVSAFHACARVLSESVAVLPLSVMKIQADGELEPYPKHALNKLLKHIANDKQTAFEHKEERMGDLCYRGKAFAQIVRSGRGKVLELVRLNPDWMEEVRLTNGNPDPAGELFYVYKSPTQEVLFHCSELWRTENHLGLSPVGCLANALGLAVAQEKSGSAVFRNGMKTSAVLRHPGKFKDKEQLERLRMQWNDVYGGSGNHHKPVILEGGMELSQLDISPKDAMYLESRLFQVEEICRAFRVPPHMIADLRHATFSNIEHQDLAFVKHSLMPWLTRLEQTAERDLLTEAEREKYAIRFNVDALLRGDYPTRMTGHVQAVQNGIMTVNEVRKLENLPPIEGGDKARVQKQMIGIDEEPAGGEDDGNGNKGNENDPKDVPAKGKA